MFLDSNRLACKYTGKIYIIEFLKTILILIIYYSKGVMRRIWCIRSYPLLKKGYGDSQKKVTETDLTKLNEKQ